MNSCPCPLARRLAVVFLALIFAACHSPQLRAANDDAKFRDELRQLKTVYENAIGSGDLAPLAPLFTPETSGVVVDNQTFKSFAELKAIHDKFHAAFPGLVYRITLNPEPSQLFGDIALARGTCDEFVKTSAGEFTYTSTWTAVLRRVDGQWKLVRSQVTMDPFRNSIVQHFLAKTKLYYGAGALVLGLLAGFIVARVTGPKRTSSA